MRFARITPPAPEGVTPVPIMQPYVLADDVAGRGAGSMFLTDFSGGFTQQTLDVMPLNAAFTSRRALKNYAPDLTLVVEREFATESECFLFKAELPLKVPSGGLLEMGVVNGQIVYFDDAVIRDVKWTDIGQVSVSITFQIAAGKPRFTNTP